jgi:hypothetical protein
LKEALIAQIQVDIWKSIIWEISINISISWRSRFSSSSSFSSSRRHLRFHLSLSLLMFSLDGFLSINLYLCRSFQFFEYLRVKGKWPHHFPQPQLKNKNWHSWVYSTHSPGENSFEGEGSEEGVWIKYSPHGQ